MTGMYVSTLNCGVAPDTIGGEAVSVRRGTYESVEMYETTAEAVDAALLKGGE